MGARWAGRGGAGRWWRDPRRGGGTSCRVCTAAVEWRCSAPPNTRLIVTWSQAAVVAPPKCVPRWLLPCRMASRVIVCTVTDICLPSSTRSSPVFRARAKTSLSHVSLPRSSRKKVWEGECCCGNVTVGADVEQPLARIPVGTASARRWPGHSLLTLADSRSSPFPLSAPLASPSIPPPSAYSTRQQTNH